MGKGHRRILAVRHDGFRSGDDAPQSKARSSIPELGAFANEARLWLELIERLVEAGERPADAFEIAARLRDGSRDDDGPTTTRPSSHFRIK